MKVFNAAHRAKSGGLDLRTRNARFDHQAAILFRQIDLRSSRGAELHGHLRADFVTALSDARSDGGVYMGGARSEFLQHLAYGRAYDTVHRPAPARV